MKKSLLGIVLIAIGLWLILPIENTFGFDLCGYSGMAWEEFIDFFTALIPLLFVVVGTIVIFIEKQGLKSEPPDE